jgi:ABC-type polysaccharide/polyol phosphate export permease
MKKISNQFELFYIFIWRDFNVKYKQAALGIAWAVLQPFSFMLLFTFIFTYALPVKVSRFPPAVFFYAGLLPWTFFASSITYSIQTFTGNHHYLKRVYFPRIILPLCGIFIALVDFLIASLLFIALLVFYKIAISINALWLAPLFLLLFLYTISLSLILSVMNVYYRDIALASSFFLQVLFFATPVLYSVEKIPLHIKHWLFLNPLTFIFENIKKCLLEGDAVNLEQFLLMFLGLFLFLLVSYKFFKFMERKLADVL